MRLAFTMLPSASLAGCLMPSRRCTPPTWLLRPSALLHAVASLMQCNASVMQRSVICIALPSFVDTAWFLVEAVLCTVAAARCPAASLRFREVASATCSALTLACPDARVATANDPLRRRGPPRGRSRWDLYRRRGARQPSLDRSAAPECQPRDGRPPWLKGPRADHKAPESQRTARHRRNPDRRIGLTRAPLAHLRQHAFRWTPSGLLTRIGNRANHSTPEGDWPPPPGARGGRAWRGGDGAGVVAARGRACGCWHMR